MHERACSDYSASEPGMGYDTLSESREVLRISVES